MPKDGTANRQRILDAAQHLVIENGFAATSLDQVIKTAGTSKGAFFHHFDSKLDLARALTERYVRGDIDQLASTRRRTAAIPARPRLVRLAGLGRHRGRATHGAGLRGVVDSAAEATRRQGRQRGGQRWGQRVNVPLRKLLVVMLAGVLLYGVFVV